MIKNNLMEILAEKDLTINKLAAMAGMRYATVWNFAKNNTQKVDYDVLNRLCKALNCTPGDILKYIPDTEEN